MRRLGVLGLLALFACGEGPGAPDPAPKAEPEVERFRVSGKEYSVPAAHVQSISREPPTFVRIKHPDVPFELVYDSRTDRARNARGAPRIFSINDGQSPNIEHHSVGDRHVVCRRAPSPRGGCGAKVRHGKAEWSVLFPFGRLGEAPRHAAAAEALLHHYEE